MQDYIENDSIFLGKMRYRITSKYFDAGYPKQFKRQHTGIDFGANIGTVIYSHIVGKIKQDGRGLSNFDMAVVITSGGLDHIFGHVRIDKDIKVGDFIDVGNPIGVIVLAGTGAHLHYGLCKNINLAKGVDRYNRKWGWGRAHVDVTKKEAIDRGWLDPTNSLLSCFDIFRYFP